MRPLRLATLATCLAFAQPVIAEFADDEAFGIRMGASRADLDIKAVASPSTDRYLLNSVPKPHPLLTSYAAVLSDRSGVCKVSGAATATSSEAAGDIANKLLAELGAAFGPPPVVPQPEHKVKTYVWRRDSPVGRIFLIREPGPDMQKVELVLEFKNYQDCALDAPR